MKKLLIFIILVSLFIYKNVYGLSLLPTGEKTAILGEKISIYLTLNKDLTESSISAVDGILKYDEQNFELLEIKNLMSNWRELSAVSNNKVFAFANIEYNDLITEVDKNIIELTFKVKDNAKFGTTVISVVNPNATDEKGDGVSIIGGDHKVKILSDNNFLKKLIIDDSNIDLKKNIFEYDFSTDKDSVIIKAILTDDKSSFLKDFAPKTIKLNKGINLVRLKVMAENGQIKTYNIKIFRKYEEMTTNNEDSLSDNNFLSKIIINNKSIDFIKEEYEHRITVPFENKKLSILVETEDKFATFQIEAKEVLSVGENIINIRVFAQNGSERLYKIILTRNEENIILSNNSKLQNLKIKGYKINFDKNVYDYNVKITNEKELEILYTKDDMNSKVNIIGNKNLKFNSTIKVIVIAEDNSTTVYRIKVTRNIMLYIVYFTIFVILLFLLLRVIFVKKANIKIIKIFNCNK